MPIITANGRSDDFAPETRLVLAIEALGINIGHRCGGKARCTTCRVEFLDGEPSTMTVAEFNKLKEKGLLDEVRLSCQILCDHDMTVRPLITLEDEPAWTDTGATPDPTVVPEAVWFSRGELEVMSDPTG